MGVLLELDVQQLGFDFMVDGLRQLNNETRLSLSSRGSEDERGVRDDYRAKVGLDNVKNHEAVWVSRLEGRTQR